MIYWNPNDRLWLMHGDCVEVMKSFAENTFDAVVCDPPYGLEFMGKGWDRLQVRWHEAWAREALRVLKPGGYLLAFGGSRTYHRLACAIEDVGFEIRDAFAWMYGSGFPKSRDPARDIEMERCVLPGRHYDATLPTGKKAQPGDHLCPEIAEVRAQYGGLGTALKPAFEPVVVARKALDGTVAANVQKWGTGAMNIDACRIPIIDNGGNWGTGTRPSGFVNTGAENGDSAPNGKRHDAGRWPANVMVDEEAGAMLDAQSGVSKSTGGAGAASRGTMGKRVYGKYVLNKNGQNAGGLGDSGGASRFFYCAKASSPEREAGLDHLPARTGAEAVEREEGSAGTKSPRAGAGRTAGQVRNHHPTVKPIAVMTWLVRLVARPGALVLDPFLGSGTTGIAAWREGVRFVGIEKEAEYLPIAAGRIWHAINNTEKIE